MLPKNATKKPNALLPEHCDERDVENLVATLHERIQEDLIIRDALEACNLQPTSRAAWLAASSAVNVLLAHELGQEVLADQLRSMAEAEGE